MTITIAILVGLLAGVSIILWFVNRDFKSMERERDYFRRRYCNASDSVEKWKNLHEHEYDNVLRLQKENAALQKQLKELTPQTPQEPWWTEED